MHSKQLNHRQEFVDKMARALLANLWAIQNEGSSNDSLKTKGLAFTSDFKNYNK